MRHFGSMRRDRLCMYVYVYLAVVYECRSLVPTLLRTQQELSSVANKVCGPYFAPQPHTSNDLLRTHTQSH